MVIPNSIKKEIVTTINTLDTLKKELSQLKDSEINTLIWQIRANLELIYIELKFSLKKEMSIEKWQTDFLEKLKGTSSRKKAIIILNSLNSDSTYFSKLISSNKEKGYRELWELKEIISSIFAAFPAASYSFRDGEVTQKREEIFDF